eukprot:3800503-Ditylum_brightwellii.AAC.1
MAILTKKPSSTRIKKNRTVQCLLDMCTTSSLMDLKFFREFLGEYKGTDAFLEEAESQWVTGNDIFTLKGK